MMQRPTHTSLTEDSTAYLKWALRDVPTEETTTAWKGAAWAEWRWRIEQRRRR